ncbi:MAG: EamA family transporter [Acidaminococcaceae bacterium]|nr:EamA family transporter [Acidaminococcaceae bacterium]
MRRSVYSYTGELCVIASAVLFGLMPLLVKIVAAHGGNVYMIALGRFFFGSLILLAVITVRRDVSLHITLRQFREIMLLSVFYALTPVLLFSSYGHMDSGMAIGLCYSPIVITGQNILTSHKSLASGVTLLS